MLGLYSCSKSELNDIPRPLPDYNSIGVQFVDEIGNDASDDIEMKLIETITTWPDHPIYRYEMV